MKNYETILPFSFPLKISKVPEGHHVYEQRRVDLATFRAVPAST